jgi:hypothetical protein
MLKSKKAVYVLIPLNIAIWGVFIYRFFSSYDEYDAPVTGQRVEINKLEELKDTVSYELSLSYKDPFLKEIKRGSNESNSPINRQKQTRITPAKTATVVPKQLPDVKYLGLIKNNSSGIARALISLNGQSHLIKVNEKVEGIIFKSFNKDSLVGKWGKKRIVARK